MPNSNTKGGSIKNDHCQWTRSLEIISDPSSHPSVDHIQQIPQIIRIILRSFTIFKRIEMALWFAASRAISSYLLPTTPRNVQLDRFQPEATEALLLWPPPPPTATNLTLLMMMMTRYIPGVCCCDQELREPNKKPHQAITVSTSIAMSEWKVKVAIFIYSKHSLPTQSL